MGAHRAVRRIDGGMCFAMGTSSLIPQYELVRYLPWGEVRAPK